MTEEIDNMVERLDLEILEIKLKCDLLMLPKAFENIEDLSKFLITYSKILRRVGSKRWNKEDYRKFYTDLADELGEKEFRNRF